MMKKYFLIQSTRKNVRPSNKGSDWVDYLYMPITQALKTLSAVVNNYNEGKRRTVSFEVYGVKEQNTVVITMRGPRAGVEGLPTALATTNFYEYFSLRKVEFPDVYM